MVVVEEGVCYVYVPIARKAGLPWDATFLVTFGVVIAGVGTAPGVAGGGTPFGGGG